MNKTIKDILSITLITVVMGLLLGTVYIVTKGPIEEQNEKTKNEAYQAVFADGEKFNELDIDYDKLNQTVKDSGYKSDEVTQIAEALDGSGEIIGHAVSVDANDGYGGTISFIVGIGTDGTVMGTSFTDISETAGLGMKASEEGSEGKPAFKDQFEGVQTDEFSVIKSSADKKDASEINAISGATITTKAVVGGVNAALAAMKELA